MKQIPPSMSIEQALRAGYLGRLVCRPFLDFLKTLPCDTCEAGPPSDPSHFNGYKGAGTKAPDGMSISQCRRCHDEYEHDGKAWEAKHGPFLLRAAIYMAVWISDEAER